MAFPKRLLLAFAVSLLPAFAIGAESEYIRCSIKVEPPRTIAGKYVTLTWSSFGATSATLEGIGSVPTSGSRTVLVNSSKKFALTVRNGADRHVCFTEVTVTAQGPTCFISAWPQTVLQGSSATITWGSSNASSLFITNIGRVPASGSRTVSPQSTITYTLTAQGVGAPCVQTTHVNVTPKASAYGYFPKVLGNFFSPFVDKTTYQRTDAYYVDDWEEYEHYYDGVYTEYEDVYTEHDVHPDDLDAGCPWWDYWCDYDARVDDDLDGDLHDPCLWEWWCEDNTDASGNPCEWGYCEEYSPNEHGGGGVPEDLPEDPPYVPYPEPIPDSYWLQEPYYGPPSPEQDPTPPLIWTTYEEGYSEPAYIYDATYYEEYYDAQQYEI